MIGNEGLSEAVLAAIDAQLIAHELIKVRVFSDDRTARQAMGNTIAEKLDANPIQHIGKILVLYRPDAHQPRLDRSQPYSVIIPTAPAKDAAPKGPHVSKKLLAAGKTRRAAPARAKFEPQGQLARSYDSDSRTRQAAKSNRGRGR